MSHRERSSTTFTHSDSVYRHRITQVNRQEDESIKTTVLGARGVAQREGTQLTLSRPWVPALTPQKQNPSRNYYNEQ